MPLEHLVGVVDEQLLEAVGVLEEVFEAREVEEPDEVQPHRLHPGLVVGHVQVLVQAPDHRLPQPRVQRLANGVAHLLLN